jgi:hypothetical protein
MSLWEVPVSHSAPNHRILQEAVTVFLLAFRYGEVSVTTIDRL